MRKHYYVGIYLLWSVTYSYVNKSIFKSILLPLEYLGFLALLINSFIILKGNLYSSVKRVNGVVLILLWAIFLFLPSYTYKDAIELVTKLDENYVIVTDNEIENYKIGAPQIYNSKIKAFIVRGNYLVYKANLDQNILLCYKVDPNDGSYNIYFKSNY